MLGAVSIAIAAALVVYSQTEAFAWDEGFHLLAARMIELGRRPYRDFLFAQTPLNAYWNAFIMWVGGYGWRGPHAMAALETAGATWLIADYVLRTSRLSIAITVALFLSLNYTVLQFANIGQAYGLSMLLGAIAFRCSTSGFAIGAGLAAGAAASATLLTAPLGPVLFVWFLLQAGWRKAFSYAVGALVGLSPALIWLVREPKQFVFDVVGFHIYYRNVDWSDWAGHDIGVLTGWLESVPALIVVSLALAGAVAGRARRDVVLCSWIAGVWCLYLATTHPTFPQYFIGIMPFAAVLASAAFEELYQRYPRGWPVEVVATLVISIAARTVWTDRSDMSWANLIPVGQAVQVVDPPTTPMYADEAIYLLSGRIPPSGLEWGSSHKIEMPLDKARPLHVLPQSELDKEVKARAFGVVETCDDDEATRLGLASLYSQKKEMGECSVYWGPKN